MTLANKHIVKSIPYKWSFAFGKARNRKLHWECTLYSYWIATHFAPCMFLLHQCWESLLQLASSPLSLSPLHDGIGLNGWNQTNQMQIQSTEWFIGVHELPGIREDHRQGQSDCSGMREHTDGFTHMLKTCISRYTCIDWVLTLDLIINTLLHMTCMTRKAREAVKEKRKSERCVIGDLGSESLTVIL